MNEKKDPMTPDKLEDALKGISIDGTPVLGYLALKKAFEKKVEVFELFREETKPKLVVPIGHARHQMKKYVPHSRVRRLTDDQIREEYGTMSRPYETMNENIVDVIFRKGPISNAEIAAETGYPVGKVVGCTSHMFRAFQKSGSTGVIVDKSGGVSRYAFVPSVFHSVTSVMNAYREVQRQNYKPKSQKAKECEHHNKLEEHLATPKLSDLVKELVKSAVGIEVNVTGGIKIEVVFRMETK